jgi:hypothetical protein
MKSHNEDPDYGPLDTPAKVEAERQKWLDLINLEGIATHPYADELVVLAERALNKLDILEAELKGNTDGK